MYTHTSLSLSIHIYIYIYIHITIILNKITNKQENTALDLKGIISRTVAYATSYIIVRRLINYDIKIQRNASYT